MMFFLICLGVAGIIAYAIRRLQIANDVITQLSITEAKRQITLPKIYKDFYDVCSGAIPANLVGTDLFNQHKELQESAFELLEENRIDNFLDEKDFVFMMHQGYIFWYFKADGNANPTVFMYDESRLKPEDVGLLSEFIKEYTD